MVNFTTKGACELMPNACSVTVLILTVYGKILLHILIILQKCVCVQRGIVTGGADKMVKFWDFELIKDKESGASK